MGILEQLGEPVLSELSDSNFFPPLGIMGGKLVRVQAKVILPALRT